MKKHFVLIQQESTYVHESSCFLLCSVGETFFFIKDVLTVLRLTTATMTGANMNI